MQKRSQERVHFAWRDVDVLDQKPAAIEHSAREHTLLPAEVTRAIAAHIAAKDTSAVRLVVHVQREHVSISCQACNLRRKRRFAAAKLTSNENRFIATKRCREPRHVLFHRWNPGKRIFCMKRDMVGAAVDVATGLTCKVEAAYVDFSRRFAHFAGCAVAISHTLVFGSRPCEG